MRVAVVGAGPAGAVAACLLARANADVVLYERSDWPRPKACGDGLTPATLAELSRLEIEIPRGPVLAATYVSGPRERGFRATWPTGVGAGTTLSRERFDAALVDAAIAAGARFEPRAIVRRCDDGRVTIASRAGSLATSHVDAVLLAEGATGGLASACGLPSHVERLVAYRGYVDVGSLAQEYAVHYARSFLPGYAWIFPVAPQRANVGAVIVGGGDVRARLGRWLASSAIARDVLGPSRALEDARGGIIPIGRRRRTAERVFALGDAAGVADPLSAEGVSQAVGSARRAVASLLAARGDCGVAALAYERSLRDVDANNREAWRMRALFAWCAGPLVEIARRRRAFARHIIATGYFPKRDAAWFTGSFSALVRSERAD